MGIYTKSIKVITHCNQINVTTTRQLYCELTNLQQHNITQRRGFSPWMTLQPWQSGLNSNLSQLCSHWPKQKHNIVRRLPIGQGLSPEIS